MITREELKLIYNYECEIKEVIKEYIKINDLSDNSDYGYTVTQIDGEYHLTDNTMKKLEKGTITENDLVNYAKNCKDYIDYCLTVDDIVGGYIDEKYDHVNSKIRVCDTPKWLQELGFDDLPVEYSVNHLVRAVASDEEKVFHPHDIRPETIKALPYILSEKPAIMIDNPNNEIATMLIVNQVNKKNLPIVLSVQPNFKSGRIEIEECSNLILTMFGRSNYYNYFNDNIKESNLIYYDIAQVIALEKQINKGKDINEGYKELLSNELLGLGLEEDKFLKKPSCIIERDKERELENTNKLNMLSEDKNIDMPSKGR